MGPKVLSSLLMMTMMMFHGRYYEGQIDYATVVWGLGMMTPSMLASSHCIASAPALCFLEELNHQKVVFADSRSETEQSKFHSAMKQSASSSYSFSSHLLYPVITVIFSGRLCRRIILTKTTLEMNSESQ